MWVWLEVVGLRAMWVLGNVCSISDGNIQNGYYKVCVSNSNKYSTSAILKWRVVKGASLVETRNKVGEKTSTVSSYNINAYPNNKEQDKKWYILKED